MNGIIPSANGPGRLADLVAELLKRFRHFSGTAEVAPGLASHLARIKISALLLAFPDRPTDPGHDGFTRLSGVLTELVARYESVPESLPRYLAPPVERLADYLEETLLKLDDGVPSAVVATDEGWVTILASFRNAGTPLEVFEDVDEIFRRWGNRWSEENLTPVQEKDLRKRWQDLKLKIDGYFQAGEGQEASFNASQDQPPVVLLLDSTFRRDQIREKLDGCGFRVLVSRDPAQALDFLGADPAPLAILCDNLEPTRHLVRLGGGLAGIPAGHAVPLVLVVGSTLAGSVDDERARSLGAVAAWADPFDPADLRRILQRLSQP